MSRYTLMSFHGDVNAEKWTVVKALDLESACRQAAELVAPAYNGMSLVTIRHPACPMWPDGLEYCFEVESEVAL